MYAALVFAVLLAAAALAVDFGNLWSQRRHMQNAADAAALEAARARCFDTTNPSVAAAAGAAYAKPPHNLASAAAVTALDSYTFRASVSIEAPTYFARAFGVDSVHVEAEAKAKCGNSSGGCNLFPAAFSRQIWDAKLKGQCGKTFYVWSSSQDNENQALDCDVYDCASHSEVFTETGRQWVDFTEATDPNYPAECAAKNGFGKAELACWIEGTAFRSRVPIPNWVCTTEGNKWGLKDSVRRRADMGSPLNIVRIPLQDTPVGAPPERQCPGNDSPNADLVYISDFGCAQVIGPDRDVELCEIDKPSKCKKFKMVQMAVSCSLVCNTGCGVGGAGEGSVRAPGLVQ